MSLPPLPPAERIALFLDFDGTLVEIAERPDAVDLPAGTLAVLDRLRTALGGALAIVTGREIEAVDGFLAPLKLPAAGIHGLARRDSVGRMHACPVDAAFLAHAETAIAPFLAREGGVLVERKRGTIALHYRARPELESDCLALMEHLVDGFEGIEIKRGKMVVEAKPGGADKGTAVRDFMAEPPFAGRLPVFAGDDVTDEDAFVAVNAMDGLSIKVGSGATAAHYRAAGIAELASWLAALAAAARV